MSSSPTATIIVTPRERFAVARRAFESVVANTPGGHRFVHVAGGAPDEIRRFLQEACAQLGHELILRPDFLAPNVARNLGLARADTDYVVFLDNDVVVESGWLEALLRCAEEEKADLVTPLCLIGEPAERNLHSFGGRLIVADRQGLVALREQHHFGPICLRTHLQPLTRLPSDYAEFHCALVRRSTLERIGPLDEMMNGSAEHIDLALQLRAIGSRGFAEPTAVVSYLPTGYTLGDLANYSTRWSSDWHFAAMKHLAQKWRLAPDAELLGDYRSDFLNKRERCLLPLERVGRPRELRQVAQTIVQLLDQMQALGYEPEALITVSEAHALAAQLFAASFRASGRPFLAHLVGTASIMAAYGANPAVVTASLLHASYGLGRFPAEVRDLSATRRWLRRRVGETAEALVFAYACLDLASIERQQLDEMPVRLAHAVLIRMANAIEDRQGDHRYFASTAWLAASNALARRRMPIFAAISERLDCGAIAAILEDACAKAEADRGNGSLQPQRPLNFSIDASSGAIVPLEERHVAASDAREPPAPTGIARHNLDLARLLAANGGQIMRDNDGVLVEAVATPWTYNVYLPQAFTGMSGPAIVEIRMQCDRGRMGVLVLERGSSVFMVAPEQSAVAGPLATLRFEIPAIEEAGDLVLRGWPHPDGAARARIFAINLLTDRIVAPAFSPASLVPEVSD